MLAVTSASHGKAHPICWEGTCKDESVSEILARVEEREISFPLMLPVVPRMGYRTAEGLRLMAIRCRGATQGSEKAIKW